MTAGYLRYANGRINRATNAGDYTTALSSLRRFYDYQFPNTGRCACCTYCNDELIARGRHHHALLNVASFHYSTGGLELAQKVRKMNSTVADARLRTKRYA